jgi:hypothetical protein
MRRRVALVICAVAALVAAGCYELPPNTPAFTDLGFAMTPTGCTGNPDNVGNGCFYKDLDAAQATGVHWARIDDSWSWVQPNAPTKRDRPQTACSPTITKNCWRWTTIDQRVLAAEQRGFKVLLVPTYAPPWAALADCKSQRCGPDPKYDADYTNFVAQSVARYRPGGLLGTHVTSWEIWNEPNGPGYAPKADPVTYTKLLKGAFKAIRSAPKERQSDIVTGGTAPAANKLKSKRQYKPLTWLQCLYDNSICTKGARGSAKGYFTAVGHHPYSGTALPLAKFAWNAFRQTAHLHEVMEQHGDGKKLVWATEVGYSSDTVPSYGIGEEQQAAYIVEAVIDWHKWSFGGPMFLFDVRDGFNPAETDMSRPDAERDKFTTAGILNYDYSSKTSAYAVYALTKGNIDSGQASGPQLLPLTRSYGDVGG